METKTDNIQELDIYYSFASQIFPQLFIVRDSSEIVYLPEQNMKRDEEEIIKAQLYLQLIEHYKYPGCLVEIGNYVKIGAKENKHYTEADIVVRDKKGNIRMIFETGSFDEYEKNKDRIVRDLFSLAEAMVESGKPEYLVYFSRAFKDGKERKKIMTIDYAKFNSFAFWKKSGCLSGKIIPDYVEKMLIV